MKIKKFLKKLNSQGKLKIVEPSKEIKNSYIEKSESNLISAKILFKNNLLEEAITLTYYSMYNMLVALLFMSGIKCENHLASIILLKEIFELENSKLFYAKKERIDKQYYTDFNIKKQEVIESIEEAEIFTNEIDDFISKMNSGDVKNYKNKLNNVLK